MTTRRRPLHITAEWASDRSLGTTLEEESGDQDVDDGFESRSKSSPEAPWRLLDEAYWTEHVKTLVASFLFSCIVTSCCRGTGLHVSSSVADQLGLLLGFLLGLRYDFSARRCDACNQQSKAMVFHLRRAFMVVIDHVAGELQNEASVKTFLESPSTVNGAGQKHKHSITQTPVTGTLSRHFSFSNLTSSGRRSSGLKESIAQGCGLASNIAVLLDGDNLAESALDVLHEAGFVTVRDLVSMRRAFSKDGTWLVQHCGLEADASDAVLDRVDCFMKDAHFECTHDKIELLSEMHIEFKRLLVAGVLLGVSFRELRRSSARRAAERGTGTQRLPTPFWAQKLLEPAEAEAIFCGGRGSNLHLTRTYLVVNWIRRLAVAAYDRHLLDAEDEGMLQDALRKYQEGDEFHDALGACQSTMPKRSDQIFRSITILYIACFPFVVVQSCGWLTPLLTVCIAGAYFGIMALCDSMEKDPFSANTLGPQSADSGVDGSLDRMLLDFDNALDDMAASSLLHRADKVWQRSDKMLLQLFAQRGSGVEGPSLTTLSRRGDRKLPFAPFVTRKEIADMKRLCRDRIVHNRHRLNKSRSAPIAC